MSFHRFYEHHKSFIEFWSESELFHFTRSGSAKSERHVCFSPSYDPNTVGKLFRTVAATWPLLFCPASQTKFRKVGTTRRVFKRYESYKIIIKLRNALFPREKACLWWSYFSIGSYDGEKHTRGSDFADPPLVKWNNALTDQNSIKDLWCS